MIIFIVTTLILNIVFMDSEHCEHINETKRKYSVLSFYLLTKNCHYTVNLGENVFDLG